MTEEEEGGGGGFEGDDATTTMESGDGRGGREAQEWYETPTVMEHDHHVRLHALAWWWLGGRGKGEREGGGEESTRVRGEGESITKVRAGVGCTQVVTTRETQKKKR